jgi:hypothetical protein
MKKYGFIGLVVLFFSMKCLGVEISNYPEFSPNNESLNINYPVQNPPSLSLKKYISIDLSAIAQPAGIFNIGLRKDTKNGWDIGLNVGKNKHQTLLAGFGAYHRIFDCTENAKYYGEFGLKSGYFWSNPQELSRLRSFFAAGLISVGRSSAMKSGHGMFFQFDITWPSVYKYTGRIDWDKKLKGIDYTLKAPSFAVLYGLLF